jgi:hypothetical protein
MADARATQRKAWVDKQIAEGSTKSRTELRAEYDRLFPKDAAAPDDQRVVDMAAKVKELFPEYAFFFEADAAGFGQDVRDLLIRAVTQKYKADRFLTEYKQTKYFLETDPSVKTWNTKTPGQRSADIATFAQTIRDNYGDLTSDEGQILAAAEGAARLGLTGNRLRSFVFATVGQSTKGKQMVVETDEADRIRRVARDYGYQASEDEVMSVLTGQPEKGTKAVLTEDALTERAKQALLGSMPHLRTQIDAGLTLTNIFRNYQQEAADVLELDPNSVSVTDPRFRAALDARDANGNSRQLSLGEWRQTLRTDPSYGYQYTKKANREATDLAMMIARAFGKVK